MMHEKSLLEKKLEDMPLTTLLEIVSKTLIAHREGHITLNDETKNIVETLTLLLQVPVVLKYAYGMAKAPTEFNALDAYQNDAMHTWTSGLSFRESMANAALGLSEAGEAQNLIKKHLYHGHSLNRAEIIKELGDVLYYVAVLASFLSYNLSEVAEINIEKLCARYGDAFSEEKSRSRA